MCSPMPELMAVDLLNNAFYFYGTVCHKRMTLFDISTIRMCLVFLEPFIFSSGKLSFIYRYTL